ncbi:MAG: TonB-dependent receptor [Dysgonamonadaceae bacterium]|jgi:TonB-linked SusC/RagA family outer membrane protein|nr:TonB-dependent receptor [Dysgonamonadaceae bacterium]
MKNCKRKQFVFFLTCCIAFCFANLNAQTKTAGITIDQRSKPVREIIRSIESVSNYVFFYNKRSVDRERITTVQVKDAPIEKVLELLFDGTDNSWRIDGNQIFITVKKGVTPTLAKEQDNRRGITGTVTDEKGEPLPGANVVVKGTSRGVITDLNGNFSIEVDPSDVLSISYIGFDNQLVTIGQRNTVSVKLVETKGELEEVVVVAYGVQKKETLTGAVSSVSAKDLKVSSSASIANALAGRISGLTSMQGSGQPGMDDAALYLRGIGTINGTSPLILIDGVPRDNIRTIDVNEVETISVLKDASATAVFGVRGANGVILITTKRGKPGKPELQINTTNSISAFTREPSRTHSVEYMRLRNQALINDGLGVSVFTEDEIAKFENPLIGLDPSASDYEEQAALRRYIYPDNDYYRMMIKRWTPQSTVNANLSGGSDRINYFMNVGFLHQGGQFKTDSPETRGFDPSVKMNRYSFRSNVDYNISKTFKLYLNLGTYIEKVNMPNSNHWGMYGGNQSWAITDIIGMAQQILPMSPGPTTIDGYGIEKGMPLDPSYLDSGHYMDRSPYTIINTFGYETETRSNLNSSLGFNFDLSSLTPGLSMNAMVSYDSWARRRIYGEYDSDMYMATVDPMNNTLSYAVTHQGSNRITIGSPIPITRYTINGQARIDYNRVFNDVHNVSAMLLGQRDYWETTEAEIPYNVLGVAGRIAYNYNSRYLAEFNWGYNGSEQFSPKKRFGFFPAYTLGWVLTEEAFMKDKTAALEFFKIRGSYGYVGNDKGQGRFLYQDDIQMSGGFSGSLDYGSGVNEGLLGNPYITWEKALKKNIGFDATLFKGLSLTFDYFTEHRTQILLTRQSVPDLQGLPASSIPKVNMGVMDNKGYEAEISYNKKINDDWTIGARGQLTYNRNTRQDVDEVPRDESYAYRTRENGWPVGQTFGYLIDWDQDGGYWTPESINDPNRVTYGFGTPKAGDFVYKDLTGDGIIDERDQAPIGYGAIPRISWGVSLSASYKGFDAYIFFQGLAKYSAYYSNQGVWEYALGGGPGTYFDYHKTAWTEERWRNGEKITYPRLSTSQNVNHVENSFFVMSRDFTRLKNAELGYTLPNNSLKALGITKLRIFLQGQNIFLWTPKFRLAHIDPETTTAVGYTQGRMFSIGANLTF